MRISRVDKLLDVTTKEIEGSLLLNHHPPGLFAFFLEGVYLCLTLGELLLHDQL